MRRMMIFVARFWILLLVLGAFSSAQASDIRVLLSCTRTSFSDLDRVEVTLDEGDLTGAVAVIETGGGRSSYRLIDPKDFFERRSIELSGWYGYTRTLEKIGSSWQISYRDECSGGTASVSCVETQ